MQRFKLLAIAAVVLLTAMYAPTARAAGQGDDRYQVLPGDNLSRIAGQFHTTVEALLQANPQITDPNLIVPGETVVIPEQGEALPSVAISPGNGPAGTAIEVSVDGFPAKTGLTVSLGKPGAPTHIFLVGQTDSQGDFSAQELIPSSANAGETWLVVATTTQGRVVQAISNFYTVTGPAASTEPTNYIVRPGDELSALAARYGTTVSAILAANPSIWNPNLIFVGQRLLVPGAGNLPPTVVIAPVQGTPGTQVRVVMGGFPANTPVEIMVGKKGTRKTVIETGQTDANGNLDAQALIPTSAGLNEEWVVVVRTTDGSGISASSNLFMVTNLTEPASGQVQSYVVKPGDNLTRIAAKFGTSVADILEDNPKITNPDLLYAGERLSIPVG